MAQPQRPFVPHRTPTRGQPAIPAADFALARPFVPGAEQAQPAILESAAVDAPFEAPDVDDFLEEPEDLPPLEHFLDPLPPISDFSPAAVADAIEDRGADEFPDEPADVKSRGAADSDWVETDWQRYDWKSAGALGDTERAQAEASDAWAETDWEVKSPRTSERPRAPADAIAMALDQIARRIRTGDLSLPGDGSVADPATIAATLAALLGVRR